MKRPSAEGSPEYALATCNLLEFDVAARLRGRKLRLTLSFRRSCKAAGETALFWGMGESHA
jgi:hypothetical protein